MGIIAHDVDALNVLFQKQLTSSDGDDDSSLTSDENRSGEVEIVGLELMIRDQEHRQSNFDNQGHNEALQIPGADAFLESDCSSLESDSSYTKDSLAIARAELFADRRTRRRNSNTFSASSGVDEDDHTSHSFTYAKDSVDLLKKNNPSLVSSRGKQSDSFKDSDIDVDSVVLAKQKLNDIGTYKQGGIDAIPSSPPKLTVGACAPGLRPVQFGNSAA